MASENINNIQINDNNLGENQFNVKNMDKTDKQNISENNINLNNIENDLINQNSGLSLNAELQNNSNEINQNITTDTNNDGMDNASDEQVSEDKGIYCDEETPESEISEEPMSEPNSEEDYDPNEQSFQQMSINQSLNQILANSAQTISDSESNQSLPETVTVLEGPNGSKVYLVGTAHFSEKSQQDVSRTIRKTQPNIVVLELCESRLSILSFDEKTIMEESKTMGVAKMRRNIQEYGVVQGVMYMLLLSLSAHLTKELGMAPGGEFRRAFQEANRVPGCVVHLGDRPVHITLRRAISSLSVWQKLKLAFGIIFSNESITKEEVEKCKQRDLLEEMLAEMTGEFPALSSVFVHERDTYLAYSLWLAASPIPDMESPIGIRPAVVVGVVGIGHVPGIVKHWGKVTNEDIPPLLKLPETPLSERIIRKSVKYSVIGVAIWGAYKLLIPNTLKQVLSHASVDTIEWIQKSIKN